jgi:two-component system chemotaxis response regulator CheB
VIPYQIIVIGASQGGTRALQSLLADLPEDFPLPVVIVLHRGKGSDEMLISVLQNSTSLPVSEAEDKELIVPRRVYLAPPDYHLLIDVGRIASPSKGVEGTLHGKSDRQAGEQASFALSTDAPVQHARPSIDVLFQSAAEIYGRRVIGIILSGASRDGAEGLASIKTRGGLALVQDPTTAENALMPKAAVCHADRVLPLPEIAALIAAPALGGSEQ